MNNALKSEFRKLLTVRSTYVLSGLALLLVFIGSFYGSGYKGSYDQYFYANAILPAASVISFAVAIRSILLMAHEYRYNTITYALTLSNSRTKVFFAKIIAVLIYAAVLSAFAFGASLALATLGASLSGNDIPAQTFNTFTYLGKTVFYCCGFAVIGLLLTSLLRSITASIVVLFIVPNIVEGLLSVVLKDNVIYLPFRALQEVIAGPMSVGVADATAGAPATASPLHGAVVFSVYVLIALMVSWALFLRRDAN